MRLARSTCTMHSSPQEPVAIIVEPHGEGCKLSARSKGDYDVHALAKQFGGGGHRRASGATIPGSLAAARAAVVEAALARFTDTPPREDGAHG